MIGPGFHHAEGPLRLEARVVVVGSGAGGAAAADRLAAAGVDVLVLEMGRQEAPATFTQREEQMFPRLFQDAGGRTTLDGAITVLQGKGVGGSTLHNLNLCKRVEPELLDRWASDRGLPELPQRLSAAYEAVEQDLSVGPVPEAMINRNNQLFRAGAQALGWANGPLKHNRVGCIGSGFCELGCAYNAKMNAARVLLPRAVAAGARVVTGVRVERVRHRFGRAVGVRGVTAQGHPVTVDARHVVLAASATGSPALLVASGLRDRWGQVGAHLHIHPGGTVGALFEQPVRGWQGIPQSWECTQLLHPTDPARRVWLLPVFGHPVATAALLPGFGEAHTRLLSRFEHLAAATAMLHDYSAGRVSADRRGRPLIRYQVDAADRAAMAQGLAAAAQILLAAGAEVAVIPYARPAELRTQDEARQAADRAVRRLDPPLAAVHPMGSLRMGADPRTSACDGLGRLHGARRIWVADGSLMPSSTGGPPQLTIYALGRLVGEALVQVA
ncbi:MAG: GMC family oxidoreductase [Alphaproteobacteria bacterium]|nr:GMC family oxidoreductase [Alphaproteobacteria bacterium]